MGCCTEFAFSYFILRLLHYFLEPRPSFRRGICESQLCCEASSSPLVRGTDDASVASPLPILPKWELWGSLGEWSQIGQTVIFFLELS